MMLTIVGIRLCELNPRRAVHMVDGANVGAVCADHFHMFANLFCRNHWKFVSAIFDAH